MSALPARLTAAWRAMGADARIAAVASFALVVTMFLPWYELTVGTSRGLDSTSLSAFGDFSWVEAAVLLVAVAVLLLLFARAERRAFHLPGGDGTVILAAGGWAALLLAWRAFDKPGGTAIKAVGLSWGFVFAFAAAGALAYAGFRIRSAHRPEPPLPGEGAPTAPLVRDPTPAPATEATEPLAGPAPEGVATEAPTPRPRPRPRPRPEPRQPGLFEGDDATRPHGSEEPLPREAPDDDALTRAHGSEEPLPRDDL